MVETTLDEIGADLGRSTWVAIDQDRIDVFAEATEDRQWIHVDPTREASGPFGATIAHGYLTLSLLSKFLLELLVVPDAGSAVNHGLDRVRFSAPVRAGTKIRAHGQLLHVRRLDAGVQTTTRITIESGAGDKPAEIADVLTRFMSSDVGQRG
ncbi:MaoC family dehydratase [Blastococcus brunescens]|uniref:MaoC family dehydratase n=1 Tax=Blastococcus brunescens TaxID=1564165 RepID=A0ABZ1B3Q5_9ACTN|nr:MaoC family dehydratase [Blastococcus sp. BMG 8361]WRL65441.1 MaoC family dehydratase [Blastococcus sp. BMG 8361]